MAFHSWAGSGGGGTGTVTSVSVVTANGFAGSVANATTTPAITLTTTVTGILQGDGTTISAASTTGTGAVVLANSPTIVTPTISTEITIPNLGLHLLDTDASHDLIIAPGSDLTADRTLSVVTGDTNMILDLTAVTDEYVLAYDTTTNTWRGVVGGGGGAVASITGTANQVLANGTSGSAQTGAVTLTTPQDIATTSTPQFARMGLGVAANANDMLAITQPVYNAANPMLLDITAGAHTAVPNTELVEIVLNLGRSVGFATGTLTLQRSAVLTSPTFSSSGGAKTITTAVGLDIAPPVAGTNVTITNNFALTTSGSIGLTTGGTTISQTASASSLILRGNIAAGTGSLAYPDVSLRSTATRTAGYILAVANNSNGRFFVNYFGGIETSGTAGGSGTNRMVTIVNGNHTTQTLSTEISNWSSSAYTRTWATGAITTQREIYFAAPTYAFVGASVITTAITLAVEAPVAGTNATITNLISARFSNAPIEIANSANGNSIILSGSSSSLTQIVATATDTGLRLTGNCNAASATTDVLVNSTATRTAGNLFSITNNTTARLSVAFHGGININTGAASSGTARMLSIANASHTNQTASASISNVQSLGYTREWATGTVVFQPEWSISAPTYAAVGSSTFTTVTTFYISNAPQAGTNATFTDAYALYIDAGATRLDGRVLEAQGADVASANNLTLGEDGNTFEITGTTQINAITTTRWTLGSLITLVFAASVTVKHNTAGGANTAVMLLAGAADFGATAGDTLTLRYSEQGGTNAWREIGRAAI